MSKDFVYPLFRAFNPQCSCNPPKFTVVHDTCVSMMIYVAEWEHMFFFHLQPRITFPIWVVGFGIWGFEDQTLYTTSFGWFQDSTTTSTNGPYGSRFEKGQRVTWPDGSKVKDDVMQRAVFTSIWEWSPINHWHDGVLLNQPTNICLCKLFAWIKYLQYGEKALVMQSSSIPVRPVKQKQNAYYFLV